MSSVSSLRIEVSDFKREDIDETSAIDRSPLLKPSEFWDLPERRAGCAACLAIAQKHPNPPPHKPIKAIWWEPVSNTQDPFFFIKGKPFVFALEINKFFDGSLKLADIQKIITLKNARGFLNELKIIESMKYSQRAKGSALPRSTRILRELCAIRSRGAISSAEAFLKTPDSSYCEPRNEFSYRASANPDNLIPERVAEVARFTCTHAIKILSLSRKMGTMGLKEPTTVIIRGNYGAGKSKLSAEFVPNPDAIPSPDTFKADLRKGTQLTNQQVQKEGTKNFQKLMYELRSKGTGTHFIFDEALRNKDQIEEILETAAITGSRVVMREIDVPLMISCLRVLSRDIETSPCIPFTVIADAFKGFRENRENWLKEVRKDRTVSDFQLLATSDSDPAKSGIVVAQKSESEPHSFHRLGSLKTFPDNSPSLYDQAVRFDPKEIDRVRKTVIDHDLIKQYANWGGIKSHCLKFYLGATIEAALNERSVETPLGTP